MALRTLAARVRTSADAVRVQTTALRLPPPPGGRPDFHSAARLSAPPAGRPCLISNRTLRTTINLKSASLEELEREAASLRGRIDEVVESISKEKERSDLIMKDIWGTMKLMACSAIVVKVITFAISPVEEPKEIA
ncbi:hypothetical protein CFC21_095115 [Triticum aestivum]|uniref:Uncharacterized protein n=2 Tax=Triticum aestivum TaxID=4565 RepID=A0A3B6RAG2_WHEAT|nr:hypothetical protein CFC21_095115 [Triticum aestivum]